MSIINLGNIRFNWRGEYNDSTVYQQDDVVRFKGDCFIAKKQISGITPAICDDWDLMVAGADRLEKKGDIVTHDGVLPVTIPIGSNSQTLQVVDGLPAWRNQATPPSNFVLKLQKVNGFGSINTRVYLMADGTIKASGSGAKFSNGDPDGGHKHLPSRVAIEEQNIKFTEVFSGGQNHYALTKSGEVWSWGDNEQGQLGHGNTKNVAVAKRIEFFIENNIKIKHVYTSRPNQNAFRCVYFLSNDGKLYGCGANNNGNLGNGTTVNQTTPVRCGSLSNISSMSISGYPFNCCAVQDNGDLWVWGWNGSGQLGLGDKLVRATPILHPSLKNVSKVITTSGVSADGRLVAGSSLILCKDGTIWSTGYNAFGQLGLGDTTERTSFTQINLSDFVTDIISGDGIYASSGAITKDNNLYLWGHNAYGQLGQGNTTNQTLPKAPIADFQGHVTRAVFGGGIGVEGCIVQAGNQLWAAGYSGTFNLGINSNLTINSNFQKVIGISGNIIEWGAFGAGYTDWGLGVLYDDGRVDACGFNVTFGETGTQSATLHNVGVLTNVIF
ncbi:hypothetical protein PT276_01525 [Orbaceae bacterium ESL0721]|nr:hypothetical protein [Orbaceae bacterium ESL0721]